MLVHEISEEIMSCAVQYHLQNWLSLNVNHIQSLFSENWCCTPSNSCPFSCHSLNSRNYMDFCETCNELCQSTSFKFDSCQIPLILTHPVSLMFSNDLFLIFFMCKRYRFNLSKLGLISIMLIGYIPTQILLGRLKWVSAITRLTALTWALCLIWWFTAIGKV